MSKKTYVPTPEEIAEECRKIREESGERREDKRDPVEHSKCYKVHAPKRRPRLA